MSGSPRLDTAITAAGVVGLADEIMKGIHHNKAREPGAEDHYLKAAIAGAIAVGGFALLKHDESLSSDDESPKPKHKKTSPSPHEKWVAPYDKWAKEHDDSWIGPGHKGDLAAEAAAAYALGRQMLGHKDHRILKLIAEGLGAVATVKEANRV